MFVLAFSIIIDKNNGEEISMPSDCSMKQETDGLGPKQTEKNELIDSCNKQCDWSISIEVLHSRRFLRQFKVDSSDFFQSVCLGS